MARDRTGELSETEHAGLLQGRHEEVAHALLDRGRADLAGWVREQIWDFEGAFDAYCAGNRPVDALRVALESGAPAPLDEAMARIESAAEPDTLRQAIALLQSKGRSMEAARLLALTGEGVARAHALLQAGDPLGAARALAEAGHPRKALDALAPGGGEPTSAEGFALAAVLAWDLGDAEGAARYAQRSLRRGHDDEDTRTLLARALGSLGHDLAAQLVLDGRNAEADEHGIPGRYRVTGLRATGLVGAAYVGFDRVTLQEVEIHLLLADLPEAGPVDIEVMNAIERFCGVAEAAGRLGHPAIRPVLRAEPRAGLLVLPRAEGPTLRSLIRRPGMIGAISRARALIAFLLEGLSSAHARGFVHGALLPSQIVCDAVGRPQLGPFGAHHLAGLAATHTGGLDEIMMVTAPELRAGAPPTVPSDMYAVGTLLLSLVHGTIASGAILAAEAVPAAASTEIGLARALVDPDPRARPDALTVLAALRAPVADVRELEPGRPGDSTAAGRVPAGRGERALEHGVVVMVAESWSDSELDALCGSATPWMQPILDRDDRRVVLAPWPEGSVALGPHPEQQWRALVVDDALDLPEDVLAAVRTRLRPDSLVRTPSGDWMIALDDLLGR